MREPSIHISRKTLIHLLKEWENMPGNKSCVALADFLLKRGVNYSLVNRSVLDQSQLDQLKSKRIHRVASSKVEDAVLFNNTLTLVRIQLKHRGITRYDKNHRDWEFIVELSNLANQFAEAFGLDKKKAYYEYIRMFFDRGNVFKLRQAKAWHESLLAKYEFIQKIQSDPRKELTQEAYEFYKKMLYDRTGMAPNYEKVPEKYVYFTEVSRLAEELGIQVRYIIQGNFESLASFSSGIPSPEQLTTANGIDRVVKWMAENSLSIRKPKDNSIVDEFQKRRKARRYEDNNTE